MDSNKLNQDTVLRQSENQVGCNLDEEMVLLNINTGGYYNFNEIASAVWGSIKEPKSLGALISELLETYEVEKELCQRDVKAFLSKLIADDLVEASNEG
ncbi:lasso peptide biosynthesis PqqD family chaperone [Puniceicoccaceae bacterium K14]|nr:lasso peptide biosynthesis PqqD family chaperone [Puniceicoccaceae bacterium K14]